MGVGVADGDFHEALHSTSTKFEVLGVPWPDQAHQIVALQAEVCDGFLSGHPCSRRCMTSIQLIDEFGTQPSGMFAYVSNLASGNEPCHHARREA